MSDNKIKIQATTMEEFKKLEDVINKLPQQIVEQLEMISLRWGITLHLKEIFKHDARVYLFKDCQQIKGMGEYIGAFYKDYTFQIPLADFHYNYIFIDREEKENKE